MASVELRNVWKNCGDKVEALFDAIAMSDTVAVHHLGNVEQIGTQDEIYYKPVNLYVAEVFCNPLMNLLPVDYRGDYAIVKCESSDQNPIHNAAHQLLAEVKVEHQMKIDLRHKNINVVPGGGDNPHALGQRDDRDSVYLKQWINSG